MSTRNKLFLAALLAWYVGFWLLMARSPVDGQNWILANILPVLLVGYLVATHRWMPLSNSSYVLVSLFLTLHTIGAHYTYAQVPVGEWLEGMLVLGRNHFDRFVHFGFGLLLTYPMLDVFLRLAGLNYGVAMYLSFITPVGLSGLWEVIESWVARMVSPELGTAYLGSQGDIWDAQKDMAAAVYGSLVSLAVIIIARNIRQRDA